MTLNAKAKLPGSVDAEALRLSSAATIFLSYSRANLLVVRKLRQLLEKEGFPVWMDLNEIRAGNWRREIVEKGIDPCRVFLLALSQDSADSEEVSQEIQVARESKKEFLPVYLDAPEEIHLPGNLRYILSGIQYQRFDSSHECLPEGIRQALRSLGVEPQGRKPESGLTDSLILRRCERLSWLIDREMQTKAFKDALRCYATSGNPVRKPLLFYLHGPDSTAMSEYRESLSRFYLPQIIGAEESALAFHDMVLEEMNLDEHSQDEWLMQIAGVLPRHVPHSVEGISGYLGRSACCSVLTFYAGTGKIKLKPWRRFLTEFGRFWERFPVQENTRLIVKLELEYTGEKRGCDRDLRAWLELERVRQEKGRWRTLPEVARVLPYLDRVKLSEARRWLHLPEVKDLLQTIHLRPHQAESQIESIFASKGDPLAMRELAGLMEQALVDHFRKHHF